MLRVLRLLRVLKTVKRLEEVQFLTATIMKIVLLSREIMTLLSVIVFIFSQVSVQLFGGLLYVGNPGLEGTTYKEEKWYVINYNDLLMACATYFVSLLVEFTPVLAEVLNDVAPIPCEWLITLFFYFTAVAVVFELVQAFTIETFVELYGRKGMAEEELFKGFHTVEEDFKDIGCRIHYRAIGGRGEKWEEALSEAFEKMLEETAEQAEAIKSKEHSVLNDQRKAENPASEHHHKSVQEICTAQSVEKKRRASTPVFAVQDVTPSLVQASPGPPRKVSDDHTRSINDLAHICHVGPISLQESEHLQIIADKRKIRRASYNPYMGQREALQ